MITLKVTRNQGFTLFLEDTFLEKPQRRVGSNWSPSCLEHFWMTASNLQQLLALYFTNIYGWQLSSSEKSMVGKKLIHVSQGFHRFRFPFFFFFIFVHFLWQMPVYLVSYAKRMLYSEQPTVLLARRHLNRKWSNTPENGQTHPRNSLATVDGLNSWKGKIFIVNI